jgi:hypothetical protein
MKTNIIDKTIKVEGSCTELAFVLDRSGSMAGSEEDIVVSVNKMLEEQRKQLGELKIHVTAFDDHIDTIRSQSIQDVQDISFHEVRARGSTALLDAIGRTFEEVDPENAKQGVMVIATDGMENASFRFNYTEIKAMIKAKEAQGWKVMYLGAGLRESKDAINLGIRKGDTIMMPKSRVQENMSDVNEKIAFFRETNTWEDKLNKTYDWEVGEVKDLTTFPDIAYLKENDLDYIVDTGSPASFQRNSEIKLHGHTYRVQSQDLMGKLKGHTLLECDGLIGNDIIQNYRLWHNRHNHRIELASMNISIVDAMHPIPLAFHYGIPTVRLIVDGKEGTFFLDTGASISYLRPGFVNRPIQARLREYSPVCGEFTVDMVDANLEILPVGYRHNIGIGIFPQDVARTLLRGIDGILGFDILKQYEFIIDLSNKTFYIERKEN